MGMLPNPELAEVSHDRNLNERRPPTINRTPPPRIEITQ
jgi:hypothetical protein